MTDDKRDDDDGIPVILPQLGESMTEATLVTWLARSGDQVGSEQPIASLSLDKIDVELEAPTAGVLVVHATPEQVVAVGDVIAHILPAPPRDHARESQHDELLAAIAAAPDDVGPRQVYADFLLEHPGPLRTWGAETVALRAEYLSLVTQGQDVRPELEACARSTARSLIPFHCGVEIEKGFVVGIETKLDTLAKHERIFAHTPITALGISGLHDAVAVDRFLALPRVEQVQRLALIDVAGELLVRIVGSPRLVQLRRLELRRCTFRDPAELFDVLGAIPTTVSLALETSLVAGKTSETLRDEIRNRFAGTVED